MAGFKLDFSGVKDFDALPEGRYQVVIEDAVAGETSEEATNSNEPYVRFEYTVTSGDYEGRKCWDNVAFYDSVMWKTKAFSNQFGIDAEGKEFESKEACRDFYLNEGLGKTGSITRQWNKKKTQINTNYPKNTGGTESLLP